MPLMVKDGKAFLFVHVPKTAGSSVYDTFKRGGWKVHDFDRTYKSNKFRTCPPQHFHAELLQSIYQIDRLSGILQFARHPVDRLLSEYFYRTKKYRGKVPRSLHFPLWWRRVKKKYSVNKFVLDNHLRPQAEFLLKGVMIGKFENDLNQRFLNNFLKTAGLPSDLPEFSMVNKSERASVRLSTSLVEDISDFYQEDFRHFGYSSDR